MMEGCEALPALPDVLVLPGEVVVPSMTWDESRAALEAADCGARQLVAVPGGRLRRGGVATLVEIVQVAHRDVRLVDAQLLGVRRVRIVQVYRGGPFVEVVVSSVPEPDQLPPPEAERLRAVIAACQEEQAELDLDAAPAEIIDQLTLLLNPPLSLRMNFKRAILRTPTVEGRLRLLERHVRGGIEPLGHSSGRGTEVDDATDGSDEGLPEVVRQAIAREEQLAGDFDEFRPLAADHSVSPGIEVGGAAPAPDLAARGAAPARRGAAPDGQHPCRVGGRQGPNPGSGGGLGVGAPS